jgi:hypothetical protein
MALRLGRAADRLFRAAYHVVVAAVGASKILLENGNGILLEDGSGVLLMES